MQTCGGYSLGMKTFVGSEWTIKTVTCKTKTISNKDSQKGKKYI